MHRAVNHILALFVLLLTALPPYSARTEPFPMLSQEEAAKWHAVGQVNAAGHRKRSGCTGTLIAPDLVVTAAHCAQSGPAFGASRYFAAGWSNRSFVARGKSAEVFIHPQYEDAEGAAKYPYDVAMIVLEDPIDTALVTPIPLIDRAPEAAWMEMLLGYHSTRQHALSGSSTCRSDTNRFSNMIIFDCEVVSGNSGGPVLHLTEDGWSLAAVLVARAGANGYALAVPVNEWMREVWQDAVARAVARH